MIRRGMRRSRPASIACASSCAPWARPLHDPGALGGPTKTGPAPLHRWPARDRYHPDGHQPHLARLAGSVYGLGTLLLGLPEPAAAGTDLSLPGRLRPADRLSPAAAGAWARAPRLRTAWPRHRGRRAPPERRRLLGGPVVE